MRLRTYKELTRRKALVKRMTEGREKLDKAVKSLREKVSEAEGMEKESETKGKYLQITTGEKRKLHTRSLSEKVKNIRSDTDVLLKWVQSKKRREIQQLHGDEKMLKDLIAKQNRTLVGLQPVKRELR